MRAKAEYWRAYYQHRHQQVDVVGFARSVEFPNERVQLQVYGHILEAVGTAFGKSILDVGCGWGNFTLMLHACGARITGVDIVPETIEVLRQEYPQIPWRVVNLIDESDMQTLPAFDCVVATEVLEHVDFDAAMKTLWAHVQPGGRLIATVPNSECPILQEGRERWGDQQFFAHISPAHIEAAAATLPDVRECQIKSLSFREDQHFLPYAASDWHETVDGVPNRIIFVLVRQPDRCGDR